MSESQELWSQLAAAGDLLNLCGSLDFAVERSCAEAGEALAQLEGSCEVQTYVPARQSLVLMRAPA